MLDGQTKFSKINIVGTSGSGKSTFSKKMAESTGYKLVEMDQIFWGPNWSEPKDEVFFENLENSLDSDQWVLDGNYTRSIPIKWKDIDVVIWLDYSFTRTMYQALRRAITRSISGEELWPDTGNREYFSKSFFSKNSIILWSIKSYRPTKKKYLSYMKDEKYNHIKFIRLRNPKETEEFFKVYSETNMIPKKDERI